MGRTDMTTTAIPRRSHASTVRRAPSRAPARLPRHTVRVSPIRTDADLVAAQRRMEALWGSKPGTPAGDELDVLGALVAAYESAHHAIPSTGSVGALRAIMDGNGLGQSDIPEVGNQSVVSQVLSGHRRLNIRQVKALAARFGVSPAAFID
jgi:HTH-type transcriptional regulator/antitoxin HigA